MNDFDFRIKKLKPIGGFEIGEYYSTLFGEAIISLLHKMGHSAGSDNVYIFDPKKAKTRFKHTDAEQYIGVCYFHSSRESGFKFNGETYQIGLIYMDEWTDGSMTENVYMVTNGYTGIMETLSRIYNFLRLESKKS